MGSIVKCGQRRDLPCRVSLTVKSSAPAITGPPATPTQPAASRSNRCIVRVWSTLGPSKTPHVSSFHSTALFIIEAFFGGLKAKFDRSGEISTMVMQHASDRQADGSMAIMPTGVHNAFIL